MSTLSRKDVLNGGKETVVFVEKVVRPIWDHLRLKKKLVEISSETTSFETRDTIHSALDALDADIDHYTYSERLELISIICPTLQDFIQDEGQRYNASSLVAGRLILYAMHEGMMELSMLNKARNEERKKGCSK